MAEEMSKRERQKARRAERLEREAREAAAAGRRRFGAIAAVVVVIVAAIAGLLFLQQQRRAQEVALAEEVAERLDELGCTPDEEQDDLGGGHIPGDAASLAAEPPEAIYDVRPPTSGRHIGQVVASGLYDIPVDERFTTHNLEHGYVIVHYDPDSDAGQIEEIRTWAQEQMDGDFPKMVVLPAHFDLPGEANLTFTAWHFRQSCETFDPQVGEVFLTAHYGTDGVAPEKDNTPNHVEGQQGVVVAEEGDENLLLPPLAGGSAAEDAQEAGVTPDDTEEAEASEAGTEQSATDEATAPAATESG